MDGLLRLNVQDPIRNPPYGAHDPGMMWDPVTERYYSYSTDFHAPQFGLRERIGIPVRSSDDLVRFTFHGSVLSPAAVRQGRDNGPYPPTAGFWAPFAEYVHGEYRLYYSATRAFGSSESRIWLAAARHPLGPFENRGVVADTWGTDDTAPNAIDPHVLRAQGRTWLVYGSFFGGIFLKELDDATGLSLEPPGALGRCIARRPPSAGPDGPEGAAVICRPETGYDYLFLSYGWLGDGYDVRVGRARRPEGPYLDEQGRDLAGESHGLKLAGSYRFGASAPHAEISGGWSWGGLRGLGHGVPFCDPVRNRAFFVHHVRDGAACYRRYDPAMDRYSYRDHYLMVRPMFFLADGWPVFGPEPFAGEDLTPLPPPAGETWELIRFDGHDDRQRTARRVRLDAGDALLSRCVCYRCRDWENGGREILALTGLDGSGRACWGKRTDPLN